MEREVIYEVNPEYDVLIIHKDTKMLEPSNYVYDKHGHCKVVESVAITDRDYIHENHSGCSMYIHPSIYHVVKEYKNNSD